MTANNTTTTSNPLNYYEYQADKAFEPNKEDSYHYPQSHDGWVHAHNGLRAELAQTQECLNATARRSGTTLQAWEVKALQRILDVHVEFIHEHHTTEDYMAQHLEKRIIMSDEKKENEHGDMVEDHVHLVELLNTIHSKVRQLEAGDNRAVVVTPLVALWNEYRQEMTEHLQQEEDVMLPLTRAYFTYKEYNAIFHKSHAKVKVTKLSTGLFVYHMGKATCREEFMKEQHIPGVVWPLVFRGAYKAYEQKVMQEAVEPLRTGEPPKTKASNKALFFWGKNNTAKRTAVVAPAQQ